VIFERGRLESVAVIIGVGLILTAKLCAQEPAPTPAIASGSEQVAATAEVERVVVSRSGLREALLDTNPATAFNPFVGFLGRNTEAAISRVYVTLHTDGEFELPLGYFHLDGDLFNLPAGPVSFAAGIEYHGERWRNNPDSENTSFDTIGSTDFEASQVNRDVLDNLSGSAYSGDQPGVEIFRSVQPRVRHC
jgi:hypothetical protein